MANFSPMYAYKHVVWDRNIIVANGKCIIKIQEMVTLDVGACHLIASMLFLRGGYKKVPSNVCHRQCT